MSSFVTEQWSSLRSQSNQQNAAQRHVLKCSVEKKQTTQIVVHVIFVPCVFHKCACARYSIGASLQKSTELSVLTHPKSFLTFIKVQIRDSAFTSGCVTP